MIREKILNIMEKNARMSVDDLAGILGEDISSLENEITSMEKEKIICGYSTVINWDKTNEEKADAYIEVRVSPQKGFGFDQIAEKLSRYPEVSSVSLISGTCDFLVFISGKSMKEVALFVTDKLSPIDGVITTTTQFVLKKYKQDGFYMERTKRDKRTAIL